MNIGPHTDISSLDQKERIDLAYQLKQQGTPVTTIAEFLSVSPKTVYNYLNKYRQIYQEELEACQSLDIVIEHLHDLNDYADLCLRMTHQIGQEEYFDPVTGEIKKKKGSLRDQAEMLRLVRDFKRMQIELQLKVGVLPTQPDRIYQTISDTRAKGEESEEIVETREDLEKRALAALEKQSWI